MKRTFLVPFAVFAFVLALAGPAAASHVPTTFSVPRGEQTGQSLLTVGDIRWVSNAQAGHGVAAPLGEIAPFERDGRRYMVASDSVYGLTVLDITDPKAPTPVSSYASSFGCPGSAEFAASQQEAILRDPRSGAFGTAFEAGLGTVGWENDLSVTPDGRIAVIGMDAPGRCHDPSYGGLEFVDLSDLTNPRPLHLVRNVGFAHSAGIDPHHPWLAYVSTSDGDDFIDVVDFRSCLGGVAALDACKPVVGRIPFSAREYPQLRDPQDPTKDIVGEGCHDLRFRATRAYCAAIDTTLIIDTSQVAGGSLAADVDLAGTLLTAGPNACPVVDATRAPGVKVTDCSSWTEAAWEQRGGRGIGAPIRSVIRHNGNRPATADIEISHQAEPIEDGKILAVTDERGGGLNEGAPACPGGGVWFYDIRDDANPKLMKNPDGSPAVFISKNTLPSPFSCTVHYGEQFGSERMLTFAWYTGGTHVLRFTPNFTTTPATIAIEEVATMIPVGAWAIQAKPIMRDPDDPDRVLVYTADMARGLDVFSVAFERPTVNRSVTRDTSSSSSGSGRGTRVLGSSERRLPKTGLWDPSVGVGFLGIAAGLANKMRRRRI